jgi:hypothetical protein
MKFRSLSLFLVGFFFYYSCEVRFEPNTRILVLGTIVDELNEPIENAEIKVYSTRATSLFSDDDFLLGRNFSKQDGTFEIVSLFDRTDDFSIEIYKDNNFSKYTYLTSTNDNAPANLEINIGTIPLKRIGKVHFNITRESGGGNDIVYSFKFRSIECIEFYTDDELDIDQSFCYEEIFSNGSLNDFNPDIEGSFNTTYGTIVEFTYSLNGQNSITDTFLVDQENYDFSFTY